MASMSRHRYTRIRIPIGKEPVVDQLARRIDKVREIQLAPRLSYDEVYVRVQARVLAAEPLTHFSPLLVKGVKVVICFRTSMKRFLSSARFMV